MSIVQQYCLESPPHLAAIYTGHGGNADAIMEQVVKKLISENKKIVGIRQCMTGDSSRACAAQLQSIDSGECHRITQVLGTLSTSWNIDKSAINRVAHALAECLSSDLDLVIVNRFGKQESAGSGFCCVIQRAIELDIPVLTVVKPEWQQRWHDFGGASVVTLPASGNCVLEWFYSVARFSAKSESSTPGMQKADAFSA